jgi:beta-hydroxylase
MAVSLIASPVLIFSAFAASVLAVQYRGRVRLPLARLLHEPSIFAAPYNVLMYLFSAVPNKPVLPVGTIPELAVLRENWLTIRGEALALFDEGRIKAADGHNDWGFDSFFRSGWKRFYLKWYEDPLPSAARLCPHTVALVNSVPGIKGAMFATLAPGGRLKDHRDPFAGSLRYHLGLACPTHPGRCRIVVDGISLTWRDGEDFLFDETYVHYAENTTDETRIILFCDIERPLHTRLMRAVNRWVSNRVIKETATKNEAGERIGALNRLFGWAQRLRLTAERVVGRGP